MSCRKDLGRTALACLGLLTACLALWYWTHTPAPFVVSDDDYARVSIAQGFAAHPSWDPSGSSWLPFPFYLLGLELRLTDGSLESARAFAILHAQLASLLLYGAGRSWGLNRKEAALGALVPLSLATSRLVVFATVPEYLTAALVSYGVAQLNCLRRAAPSGHLLFGALALCLASLSRYEAWPVALSYALLLLFDGFPLGRRRLALQAGAKLAHTSITQASGARLLPGPQLLAAGLALSGMLAWCTHGYLHRGDLFFFIKRVVAYKHALGGDVRSSAELLLAAPRALLEHGAALLTPPLVTAIFLGASSKSRSSGQDSHSGIASLQERVRELPLPLLALATQLLFLVLGDLRGGAPTHHPERALLAIWFTLPLWALRATRALEFKHRLGLVSCGLLLAAPFLLKPQEEWLPARQAEESLGRELRRKGQPGRPVVFATSDYGYFATMAAMGHRSLAYPLDARDPRLPPVELKKELALALSQHTQLELIIDQSQLERLQAEAKASSDPNPIPAQLLAQGHQFELRAQNKSLRWYTVRSGSY